MFINRKRKKVLNFHPARVNLYNSFWTTAAKQINAEIKSLENHYFQIAKNGKTTLVQFHYVNIDSYQNLMLVGQKALIHNYLTDMGFRVPGYAEFDLYNIDIAENFMKDSHARYVVKPSSGSGGFGITTGVHNKKRLFLATLTAAASFYENKLLIEEEIQGGSYRLLYLDGNLIDVIKRNRPTVIGDGKNTLRTLIHKENQQRTGQGQSKSLTQINIDLDSKFYLKDNCLTLNSIPKKGDVIVVKNVVNENSNRDNSKILDGVHQSFNDLAISLKETFGLLLIGIDVMTSDIKKSLEETNGAINEVNIPPGLHYHELVENYGDKSFIGNDILNYIFSK